MNGVALARLLRLASPALPVGAFSYSQGLEWAVEAGRVSDEDSAREWIASLLAGSMARFEMPMFARFYAVWHDAALCRAANDDGQAQAGAVSTLNEDYLATRETAELRAESIQMGRALRTVLIMDAELDQTLLASFEAIDSPVFPNAFAFAAAHWNLALSDSLTAYAWSWLENQVSAAIKLVPLGQSAGQRILVHLTSACSKAVDTSIATRVEDWSNFSPLYAIASSRHEKQYTRLFRS